MMRFGGLFGYRVTPEQVPFVVPFESHTGFVGTSYFEDLARKRGGRFRRNAPDMGLMEDFDVLAGPSLDPRRVHPLIREFYEHTTRFTLDVRPSWSALFLPGFWLFRKGLAERIGQANLPFDLEEAQQGIVSHLDTIDFDGDSIVDLRGWVRGYDRPGGEAIYVGIYTTFRHDGVGYVSVGFPLPEANLTATLVPSNQGEGDFLLKTHYTGTPFAGDYLAWIDNDDGMITVLKLDGFEEEIDVHVKRGQLFTDHRFYLLGHNFLTLYYTIRRRSPAVRRAGQPARPRQPEGGAGGAKAAARVGKGNGKRKKNPRR